MRDLGGCRTEDTAGAGATGTPGAVSEQRVPGQVTLLHPQWWVLEGGHRWVHAVLFDPWHAAGLGLILAVGFS